MEGKTKDILIDQYTSVFTKPRNEYLVNDCHTFFNNYEKCEIQKTHICELDDIINELYNHNKCEEFVTNDNPIELNIEYLIEDENDTEIPENYDKDTNDDMITNKHDNLDKKDDKSENDIIPIKLNKKTIKNVSSLKI